MRRSLAPNFLGEWYDIKYWYIHVVTTPRKKSLLLNKDCTVLYCAILYVLAVIMYSTVRIYSSCIYCNASIHTLSFLKMFFYYSCTLLYFTELKSTALYCIVSNLQYASFHIVLYYWGTVLFYGLYTCMYQINTFFMYRKKEDSSVQATSAITESLVELRQQLATGLKSSEETLKTLGTCNN